RHTRFSRDWSSDVCSSDLDVQLDVGVAHQQSLRVGVDGDELDALETDLDHPVDGIDTTAADTDDFDDCEVVLRCCHVEGLSPRVTCRRLTALPRSDD